jgi:hypothetical protein
MTGSGTYAIAGMQQGDRGFRDILTQAGRREATMAPTVTSITTVALPSHQSKMWVPG